MPGPSLAVVAAGSRGANSDVELPLGAALLLLPQAFVLDVPAGLALVRLRVPPRLQALVLGPAPCQGL
eukprot:11642339-Alexandrium_andersonii.AAC.1